MKRGRKETVYLEPHANVFVSSKRKLNKNPEAILHSLSSSSLPLLTFTYPPAAQSPESNGNKKLGSIAHFPLLKISARTLGLLESPQNTPYKSQINETFLKLFFAFYLIMLSP